MTGVLSSLRYLLSDVLGIDDSAPPSLPDNLPAAVRPIASEAVARLIEYQGPGYAQLYVDRLRRFVRRRNVDDALLAEIARLMALRMSYEDPLRTSQIRLMRADVGHPPQADEIQAFWLDEFFAVLPAALFVVPIVGFNWGQWCRIPVSIRFSAASRWGMVRLKLLSGLRRWRLLSGRYAVERVWVERWLHMIDRSLVKQPRAAFAIVQTATMIQGVGERYRRGLEGWHSIIDGLVKPTFDGELALPDLAGAVAEARAAAERAPHGDGLRRAIAEIRVRAGRAGSGRIAGRN